MEEENFRDAQGRLLPGHRGLRPKGSSNRLQGAIKEKLTEFIAGKLESLEEIYSEVQAKDKLKFLTELLAYILPKSKIILESDPNQDQDFDESKLTEEDLREIIRIQNKARR